MWVQVMNSTTTLALDCDWSLLIDGIYEFGFPMYHISFDWLFFTNNADYTVVVVVVVLIPISDLRTHLVGLINPITRNL